ncbi:hypothetical protein QYF61_002988 [Mycteria americana]|uniref:Uncharacterized protein n=1 Tax=Mycteria americana TaxID=33587 RepID=A0AAN7NEA2_MYCAM|nr:hypothetical protein QYF61_002988 [Mycteria americana]
MSASTLLGSFVKVCSDGRCVIPKVLRRRCSGCWQQWAKRKAVWLGGNGVDMLLLSLLHQNFDGWVGLLNRWNDWKKFQKSEYSPIFIFSSRCLSTEPCPWLSYLIGVKETQNFALSGVLIRRNSPWDRADSLARFVLPHPTGRRGLSGLQRAPTCRLGTPSAPLLRSGVQAPKASLHSRNGMGISVSSVSRGRKRLLEAEAMKQSP